MELRAEKDMRIPGSSSSFGHHLPRESPTSGENRREMNHHISSPQTLDHHLHLQRTSVLDPISPGSSLKTSSKPSSAVKYRECLKNHAASIGGTALDGCGEFMPSGEEGTLEALKCAACDCHRNFHRKETDGDRTQFSAAVPRRTLMVSPTLQLPPPPLQSPTSFQNFSMVQPMNVAFGGGGGGGGESSSEDLNTAPFHEGGQPPSTAAYGMSSKKRFRTKFTQEQKEKMMEFAERVGWRFQRQNDEQVDKFCEEIGVKRQVFKVWMHNNKSSARKEPPL